MYKPKLITKILYLCCLFLGFLLTLLGVVFGTIIVGEPPITKLLFPIGLTLSLIALLIDFEETSKIRKYKKRVE